MVGSVGEERLNNMMKKMKLTLMKDSRFLGQPASQSTYTIELDEDERGRESNGAN